jgi:hypothetical protein
MVEYAKRELSRIKGDEMQERINQNIIQVVEMFSKQGHSRFSARYAITLLERLLRFKPLSSLTGNDDEWAAVIRNSGNGDMCYQNKRRCSSVFKDVDSDGNITRCVDNDAVVVSDNGGITWFSSNKFSKPVTFPYYPPTHAEKVYIEYTEDVPPGFSGDKYEIITDQPDRIKALYERKRKEFDDVEWED